ncbi:MAG: FliA/WhiG family RNA polymerase sigma factor [Shouchella clausii]|jgi:RNA polymerase sigma factor FliA
MANAAELWKQWDDEHSEVAAEALIEHYMPLVAYHVQRISNGLPSSISKDELKSHALSGLLDAIAKFDSKRALKFDTYASFRIRGAIIDGLRKEDRLPRTIRDKVKKLEQITEQLEQEKGRSVLPGEVAAAMGLPEKEVEALKREQFTSHTLSLDDVMHMNDHLDPSAVAYQFEDEQAIMPDDKLVEEDTRKELAEMIKELGRNEQLVIQLSYYEELSLTEIGRILNLSTSRISQIHARAIAKLRKGLQKKEFVR